MFIVCDTKSGRYYTDLDTSISKQHKAPVHVECYHEEVMSPGCLLFNYLGLYTN